MKISIQDTYRIHRLKIITQIDQILVSGSNFLISLIFARILGLNTFGVFALAWMLVLFISSLHQAFLLSPMANLIGTKSKREQKYYIDNLFYIQLLFAITATIITFILVEKNHYITYINYFHGIDYSLAIAIFAYLMHDYYRKIFIALKKTFTTLILDVINNLLIFGLTFYHLHYSSIDLNKIFYIIFISYLTTAFLGFLIYPKIKTDRNKLISNLQKHWHLGKWLICTSILQWFSANYFIVLAGSILGPTAAGSIRIALNIVGVINIFFIAIESHVPTSASRIFHFEGINYLFFYLRKVALRGLTVTLSICLLIVVFAKEIILFLYNTTDHDEIILTRYLALFYILVFIAIPFQYAIRTLEQHREIFYAQLFSAIFCIFSAQYLVSHYHFNGVITGIMISQLIILIWYIIITRKYLYAYAFSARKS